jgi:hypothetical protein
VRHDTDWPKSSDFRTLSAHLDHCGACDGAYESLRRALKEYQRLQEDLEAEDAKESLLLGEGIRSGRVVAIPSWRTRRTGSA